MTSANSMPGAARQGPALPPTMQAAVLHATRDLRVDQVPVPIPKPLRDLRLRHALPGPRSHR
jgi:hypothetical protein